MTSRLEESDSSGRAMSTYMPYFQTRLIEALEQLQVHDHLCLIYDTQVEQFAAAVPFIRLGLERGERCIYIADENSSAEINQAMRADGIDVDTAYATGALVLASKQDTYLKQGCFDPQTMIEFLTQAVQSAKAAGFTALRVTGEMTWALGNAADVERLIEYEARLNNFLPANEALAICQYNRRRFAPEIILDVIRTHPLVIFGNMVCHNFYYTPPEHFLQPNRTSLEVERLLANLYDREQAEEWLRASEARYHELADSITDIFFAFGHRLNYTYWNKASEKLMGLPAEAAIGKTFYDLFPDQRGSEAEQVYLEVLRTRQPKNFVAIYEQNNQPLFFEITAYPTRDGLAVLAKDVTERKKAEETLRQRNRDLALLNRASHVFISTLDLDKVLTVVLEEVRQMLGVLACSAWLIDPATDELVCRQVTTPQSELIRGWRMSPGQGLAGWVTQHGQSLIVADVLNDPRHYSGVDKKTGLPLRSILTVPLWARQRVIGVIQVVDAQVDRFDQTDLTLLESLAATAAIAIENARLYEQARQNAETKAALLNEVNHRVKNNLAAIIGLLYAEQRHAGLADQPIYQEIMTDLVNRVQGLATVHSMLSASQWEPISLSELVRLVVRSSLQALPPDKQVAVAVNTSPVQVTANQAHNLALIINELTTNTIRHALTGRYLAQITVNIYPQADRIWLEFRDDGPGYPEEVLREERHGVGFELINPLVRKSLRGELSLQNNQGAVAIISFTNLAAKGENDR